MYCISVVRGIAVDNSKIIVLSGPVIFLSRELQVKDRGKKSIFCGGYLAGCWSHRRRLPFLRLQNMRKKDILNPFFYRRNTWGMCK
jgi:hypothetical protein